MSVYVAYALLLAHVSLGALQSERRPVLGVVTGIGFLTVLALHTVAARREHRIDSALPATPEADGFVKVAAADRIPENRAVIVDLSGERVAVFRYDGKVSAVSNVCQHQNGPLGEGRIIDGCITCPWHGYQYLPDSGSSPPPFTEKIPTFRTRIMNGDVYVHPCPLAAGTHVEPARIS
jgi:nitrite reductase/ring-hydroxylating ferredoxin subunit